MREWVILSTGRCGSTAVSDLIRRGTGVTSLSEFLTPLQPLPDPRLPCSGDAAWEFVTTPRKHTTTLTAANSEPEEFLYQFGVSSRFTRENGVAPLCVTTLPHLVGNEADQFLEAIEGDIRALPSQPIAHQLYEVAKIIARKFGCVDFVERSGGTSGYISSLHQAGFAPRARLIHLYRNGLDTALSMQHHSAIRLNYIRYLQICVFGEDFYAEELAGFKLTVPRNLAEFIVGKADVSTATKRDLEALHPNNFDPAALWRIRLPLELFTRSWSRMCAAAERFLRNRQVVHLSFDRITSGEGVAELEKLREELGAEPERWANAVARTIRRRTGDAPPDSRVMKELEAGSSTLQRMLTPRTP